VATRGAKSWAFNKYVPKQFATFERRILGRMFGEIIVNENWKKRYNEDLMQVFGELEILSFVRISPLNWIGKAKGRDSKRNVSQVIDNNPHRKSTKRMTRNKGWNYVQMDIKKTQNFKTERDIKKKKGRMCEVHQGGEGMHCTLLPCQKQKKIKKIMYT
jgi:hypothetical protein